MSSRVSTACVDGGGEVDVAGSEEPEVEGVNDGREVGMRWCKEGGSMCVPP